MRVAPAFLLAFALSLVACAARNPGGLQQWTDANGNVRYTTAPQVVPRDQRETLARVEPGRSAQQNAAALPGSRTEPLTPPSAAEWLKGQAPDPAPAGLEPATDPGQPEDAAEIIVPVPAGEPFDPAALAVRIRALESEIAEAEVELADATAADPPADAEQLRRISGHLEELQSELASAREQQAGLPSSDAP